MSNIHETAIVDPSAKIDPSAEVGAYTIVGKDVKIGKNTWIGPHVTIGDRTTIGDGNKVFQFASIGGPPQDMGYKGEPTQTIIGNNNTIREYVTVNAGTEKGGGKTTIGSNNLLMAYVHVAHDCIVGDHVVLANCVTLAGHVEIENNAIVGGLTPIHQYCRIGSFAMVGGGSVVTMDIPPYVMAVGNRAHFYGLNLVGLRRNGFSREAIKEIKHSYNVLFRSQHAVKNGIDILKKELPDSEYAERFVKFIEVSNRGLARVKVKSKGGDSDGGED